MFGWLRELLSGPETTEPRRAQPRTRATGNHRAEQIMRELNPNALHGHENGREIFIEDYNDADGRPYRLEYQCNPDGSNCSAWVRHNPWGDNPHPSTRCHLFSNGKICLPSGNSGLRATVQRGRYFCNAYSYFRENGTFPNP